MFAQRILIIAFALYAHCNADCQISTAYGKHIGNPQPLLLRKGGHFHQNEAFLLPSNGTNIQVKRNEEIHLHCPGTQLKYQNQLLKQDEYLQCVDKQTFNVQRLNLTGNVKDFVCAQLPRHESKLTGRKCAANQSQEAVLGYRLSDGRFLNHINVCFDAVKQNVLYTQYNLTEKIYASQLNAPRPLNFIQSDFYNPLIKLQDIYSRNVQRSTINRLVGLEAKSQKYVHQTNDSFLARGHLTAKVDFLYSSQQNLTFYYANVAPQWQTFNGNNWNSLEQDVRAYAATSQQNLTVYTGTHDILHLPHEVSNKMVPIYLYQGSFQGVPVPKFYWKVLYDPKQHAGIAFIGLNNPYHFNATSDIFCRDICDSIEWPLHWNRTNVTLGYSYCCNVNDFRKTVTHLPNFHVNKTLTHYAGHSFLDAYTARINTILEYSLFGLMLIIFMQISLLSYVIYKRQTIVENETLQVFYRHKYLSS